MTLRDQIAQAIRHLGEDDLSSEEYAAILERGDLADAQADAVLALLSEGPTRVSRSNVADNDEGDQVMARIDNDQMREAVDDRLKMIEITVRQAERTVVLDAEEQEAMDALARYMEIVWHRWGLRCNQGEQAAAVHVLQGAVQQHMLHRLNPSQWGNWWDAE